MMGVMRFQNNKIEFNYKKNIMNQICIFLLKAFRKQYSMVFRVKPKTPECEQDPDKASQLIIDTLMDDKPCMIGRFGSTELACIMNYVGVKSKKKQLLKYISGKANPWWWDKNIITQMQLWSGFFPPTVDKIEQFCELMIADASQVDILGSWLSDEFYFEEQMKNIIKVKLDFLNPFFSKVAWTIALQGKKVLVVHPFSKTIESQYKKRELLFENNLLPDFELKTIKAVQSIAGEKTDFTDWFEALEYMKAEIDKVDYDICLIGCGAYGFPLAAHVKRMGKKGFHIGGGLQLLFGISGKRWEKGNFNDSYNYKIMNEHWVRPGKDETPQNADTVEGSCYW